MPRCGSLRQVTARLRYSVKTKNSRVENAYPTINLVTLPIAPEVLIAVHQTSVRYLKRFVF
ncbi:MAG: hypothetical protein RMY36_029395 [Nostoc sp. SerVER01]|nr:hypothetical protein [Nostoc sp. SerVER01]